MEGYLLIFLVLVSLVVLYFAIRLIAKPVKILTRILINCLVACVGLIVINILGMFFGFHLPVNLITIVTVGLLGVPGLGLVTVLNYLFI